MAEEKSPPTITEELFSMFVLAPAFWVRFPSITALPVPPTPNCVILPDRVTSPNTCNEASEFLTCTEPPSVAVISPFTVESEAE